MVNSLLQGFAGGCLAAALMLASPSVQDSPVDVNLPWKPTYTVPTDDPVTGIQFRDVTGDGLPELFCTCWKNRGEASHQAFISDRGRFGKPSWRSKPTRSARDLALADLDGDGDADVVVAHISGNRNFAFRNLGQGSFERAPFWTPDVVMPDGAMCVMAGDFNEDGFQDILLGGRLYSGSKGGPNRASDWSVDRPGNVRKTALADVDGDGRKDLVLTRWQGTAYSVHRGLGKHFEKTPSFEASVVGEFTALAVGDLDGDGFPEIVVGSNTYGGGDGRVRLYSNTSGKPSAESAWMTDDVDSNAAGLALADFDRDKDLDLFVLADDRTAIFENRRGRLATQPCWRADIKNGAMAVEDFDGNGWLDLAVAGPEGVRFYMAVPGHTLPKAKPSAADPFPPMPELPPLTRRDLLPEVDPGLRAVLDDYRKSPSDDALSKLRKRAPAALVALEVIEDPELEKLAPLLRGEAEKQIDEFVGWLKSDLPEAREAAMPKLVECGAFALPALDKAAKSTDRDTARRARRVRDQIAMNPRGPLAI